MENQLINSVKTNKFGKITNKFGQKTADRTNGNTHENHMNAQLKSGNVISKYEIRKLLIIHKLYTPIYKIHTKYIQILYKTKYNLN